MQLAAFPARRPGATEASRARTGLGSWPVTALAAAAITFGLDRVTKFWVTRSLVPGQELFPNWPVHIQYVENSGAAFSILPNYDWLFLLVAAAVIGAAIWYRHRLAAEGWWVQAAVGMVVGGALANAIDRLTQGYVVDFIQLPHWPVFNVADSGITVGMVLLVVRLLMQARADA